MPISTPVSTAPKNILVTGASSGFGALTVRTLARAGHTVYAGMRQTAGRNAPAAAGLAAYADEHGVRLHAVELDVSEQESADAAVARIVAEQGRIDVVVHNAGHMVLGRAEAFTPEQLAAVYDTNVLGTQRVNRAALPHLRERGEGLLVWVGSSSTRGGCPPFLAPYFAAKAAMDALAVSYAAEVIRFGVDTSIVVPGAFTSGTNHFAHAGAPADTDRAAAYDAHYKTLMAEVNTRLADLLPPDADVADVAAEIARVVELPAGRRPFRTHIDPSRDGSEVVSAVADRIRVDFFRRVGLTDLLTEEAAL
ncbi:NADP-dependent 3-hydroxy acid dehydrogenase YdfG [Actinacidiphila alni]|uniref:NADP-dependent 3-hydroxy acid dehydrogenase YdfG n=1 Tax=Actinacidiphila alni TaxID=380248 RepID=A0A1I2IQZ2_9ACTN|nr:SDR family NAD(P)-dependent oxidoreductase [Actinacidiphila alni]SFF44694.1 NADP-dependent 3-hydroxy acid dehydrogenase YdfG [Actinacidiphila alni]